jgi:hypothetical protein
MSDSQVTTDVRVTKSWCCRTGGTSPDDRPERTVDEWVIWAPFPGRGGPGACRCRGRRTRRGKGKVRAARFLLEGSSPPIDEPELRVFGTSPARAARRVGAREGAAAADQDAGSDPDADARHRGQTSKRGWAFRNSPVFAASKIPLVKHRGERSGEAGTINASASVPGTVTVLCSDAAYISSANQPVVRLRRLPPQQRDQAATARLVYPGRVSEALQQCSAVQCSAVQCRGADAASAVPESVPARDGSGSASRAAD